MQKTPLPELPGEHLEQPVEEAAGETEPRHPRAESVVREHEEEELVVKRRSSLAARGAFGPRFHCSMRESCLSTVSASRRSPN